MTWLGLVSHVADVGTLGVPYIGEGAWGASQPVSPRLSRWPERWWSCAPYGQSAGGSQVGRWRPADLTLERRSPRHWPRWTWLRGRRNPNPRFRAPDRA